MIDFTVVPVTPFQQNCSILRCTESGRGAVVDPGGQAGELAEAVRRQGIEVERVLLTHGHVDHAGGAAELARLLDVPVEGPHRGDDFYLAGLPEAARMFGLPEPEVVTPERWLEHGERVTVGECELEVLHCPGHTPGHVIFFYRAGQLAFTGDVLFAGSIGRTDLPGGDFDTLIESIQSRLLPLGDEVRFLSGHGPMSTLGRERSSNPFLLDPDRFRGMM